ncbi:hypothetical protein ACHAW6_010765 [Cyclotella cf. meneghiniana]
MKDRSSLAAALLALVAALDKASSQLFRGTIIDSIDNSPPPAYSSICKSIIAIGSTLETYHDTTKLNMTFSTDEQFVCELFDGSDIPIEATLDQMEELRALLNNGTLVSAESSIEVQQQQQQQDLLVNSQQIQMMMRERPHPYSQPATTSPIRLTLPPGQIKLRQPSTTNSNDNNNTRRLTSYHGDKPVLVVKVTDVNGLSHPDSPSIMSDKVFGTYGDTATMKSQFAACSFNKLNIIPGGQDSNKISRELSAPGVVEVNIPIDITTSTQGDIRKEVKKSVEDKLGFILPGVFHHVMIVLEGCYIECGWSAYAFVNSWLSVYKGNNYKYPAVQLHEIGHNLNMAHSGGVDGKIYTDHTCVMGNPLFSDSLGKMCYNAAKNYQFASAGAWYNDKPEYTISWDSGSKPGTIWSGRIIGIAEYDNNPGDYPIAVRIVTGTDRDLFLGFNRQIGMNADVKEAGDEVTITEAGNGRVYAQSFLKSLLREGETYKIDQWRGSGRTLSITVNKIDISVAPGYADVTMMFGNPPPPTPPPTPLPTPPPTTPTTNSPTLSPTRMAVAQLPATSPPTTPLPSSLPTTQLPTSLPTPHPTNPPAPSTIEVLEYSLENRESKGTAKALTFTIRARRDLTITGFDIPPRRNRVCQMQVYTKAGDYRYHDDNAIAEGWSTVYDDKVKLDTKRLSDIRVADGQEVFIPQWEVQSFVIYCNRGMIIAPGKSEDEGVTFAENEDIEVKEGIKSKKAFSQYTGYGQLMGKVRYYIN